MFSRKDLIRLLVPLIIEQFLSVLVGMLDVVMVAEVGEAAVSGVSLVDSINLLLIQLLAAMATGGAVVAGQALGMKDEKMACLAADQLLLVTTLISLGIMALSLLGNGLILDLLYGSIESDVMHNASVYFYITALSFPFLAVYNSCAALYRIMGNSKVSMKTSLLMNCINVAGNAIGVYVLHAGVAGVAVPTLVSRAVAAIVMLVIIRDEKNQIHVDRHFKLGFRPDVIRDILHIGIPNGMENGMFQLGKIMVQSLVSTMGTASIAGFAFAAPNALRAVSDVTFTMLVSVGSMWAFRIGLAYVFVKFFDLPVLFVWVAMSFDWIFRFILFIWRFKSGKWKGSSTAAAY